jgi:hypothetical protein
LGVALAGLNVLDQSSMCQVGYPTTKQAWVPVGFCIWSLFCIYLPLEEFMILNRLKSVDHANLHGLNLYVYFPGVQVPLWLLRSCFPRGFQFRPCQWIFVWKIVRNVSCSIAIHCASVPHIQELNNWVYRYTVYPIPSPFVDGQWQVQFKMCTVHFTL